MLAISIILPITLLQAAAKEDISVPPGEEKQTSTEENLRTAPLNAKILISPVLKRGEDVLIHVVNSADLPLADVSVSVNGKTLSASDKGELPAKIPDFGLFSLSLFNDQKKTFAQVRYERSTSGFLTVPHFVKLSNLLWTEEKPKQPYPQILYSPATIQPGSLFLILGNNFSCPGKESNVFIDGIKQALIAQSQLAIIARANADLSIGPLQQVRVSTGDLSSNAAEIDVCQSFTTLPKNESKPDDEYESSPEAIRVGIKGSNLPVLLQVTNQSSDDVTLWLPDQQPMGKSALFVSSGGDDNGVNLSLKRKSNSIVKLEINCQPDLPWEEPTQASNEAQKAAEYSLVRGQIMRLARRLTAVQLAITQDKAKLESTAKKAASENQETSELTARLNALQLRESRLAHMLDGRRIIYASMGASADDYRQALDDAANGALLRLETAVKPVLIEKSLQIPFSAPENPKSIDSRASINPLRWPEPVIRLLPPLEAKPVSASATIAPSGSKNVAKQTKNSDQSAAKKSDSHKKDDAAAEKSKDKEKSAVKSKSKHRSKRRRHK